MCNQMHCQNGATATLIGSRRLTPECRPKQKHKQLLLKALRTKGTKQRH